MAELLGDKSTIEQSVSQSRLSSGKSAMLLRAYRCSMQVLPQLPAVHAGRKGTCFSHRYGTA